MSSRFPKLVTALVMQHDAWIVGSAADPSVVVPRDYDVVVPFYGWGLACHLIPCDAKVNSFGGWKIRTEEGIEVDVWPGDLGWIMRQPKAMWAWHPSTDTRIRKV